MSDTLDIDLYQASMLHAYFNNSLHEVKGAMEVFSRRLPENRSFFVVAGIDRIVDYLANFKFTTEDIKFLCSIESLKLTNDFCNYLSTINLSKNLKLVAMREGEMAFPNEPLLRLEGPIGLCQYVEKKILSIINHDVRIASKAVRIVLAAKGKPVLEFGGRRAHDKCSADTARAAYIAGCYGTSNVNAAREYGIPCYGTMGHVWIMSHESEEEAFSNWNKTYPESTYLVDTYHARTGTENAIKSTKRNSLGGIRLDSGDLLLQSCDFKRLLINSDNINTKLIASDDLNEYKIKSLMDGGAQIDMFGVGTEIVSTPDAPTCGFVYKLVSVENKQNISRNICKISDGGKSTWPGKKQVFRHYIERNNNKYFTHDVVDFSSEKSEMPISEPLLQETKIVSLNSVEVKKERIELARAFLQQRLQQMPAVLKLVGNTGFTFPVEFSEELSLEKNKIVRQKQKGSK
jgi:nicotinate phosphoribosyltransferase